MAETRIADVIVPEIFTAYTREQSILLSNFWRSGIIVTDPNIPGLLAGGGRTFNLPFWKDTAPADEVPSETVAATVNNITSDVQIAVRQLRILAWGANDMAAALAGEDPMLAIGDKVASAWASRYQQNVVSIIEGVIADNVANDSGDLLNSIASESIAGQTAATLMNSDGVIDTVFLLGDQNAKFSAIAMHSKPYSDLSKLNLITFQPTSAQDIGFGTYLGLTVVVDDAMFQRAGTTDGVVYRSYIFQPGAIAGGFAGANIIETEVDRNPGTGAGIDELYTRRQFAFHPQGTAYLSPVIAGEFPVNTELDDALSWNRVMEKKNMGFVVLDTN